MSKPKLKSSTTAKPAKPASAAAGKSIVESAQHIWLAGLGAFSKAQDEGTRLFEALVREGIAMEQKTRKTSTSKAEEARGAMEAAVGQARERSQETWDKLEKIFETRVSRALSGLGIPGSKELGALSARVEELTREVQKMSGKTGAAAVAKPAGKSAAKPSPAKAAAKPAAKTAAPKAAAKKTVSKTPSKAAVAKAPAKRAAAKSGATRSVKRVKDVLADVARELESAQLQDKPLKKSAAKKPS